MEPAPATAFRSPFVRQCTSHSRLFSRLLMYSIVRFLSSSSAPAALSAKGQLGDLLHCDPLPSLHMSTRADSRKKPPHLLRVPRVPVIERQVGPTSSHFRFRRRARFSSLLSRGEVSQEEMKCLRAGIAKEDVQWGGSTGETARFKKPRSVRALAELVANRADSPFYSPMQDYFLPFFALFCGPLSGDQTRVSSSMSERRGMCPNAGSSGLTQCPASPAPFRGSEH